MIISFIASLVALFGVPGAVWKSLQAERAAEAARIAAEQTRSKLIDFQTSTSLSSTIEQMESLKSLHRIGAWPSSLERYSSVRKGLVSVRERQAELSREHRIEIQASIVFLGNLERQVEKFLLQGGLEPDTARVNKLLSSQLEQLQVILHSLEHRTTGGRDV